MTKLWWRWSCHVAGSTTLRNQILTINRFLGKGSMKLMIELQRTLALKIKGFNQNKQLQEKARDSDSDSPLENMPKWRNKWFTRKVPQVWTLTRTHMAPLLWSEIKSTFLVQARFEVVTQSILVHITIHLISKRTEEAKRTCRKLAHSRNLLLMMKSILLSGAANRIDSRGFLGMKVSSWNIRERGMPHQTCSPVQAPITWKFSVMSLRISMPPHSYCSTTWAARMSTSEKETLTKQRSILIEL